MKLLQTEHTRYLIHSMPLLSYYPPRKDYKTDDFQGIKRDPFIQMFLFALILPTIHRQMLHNTGKYWINKKHWENID